MLKCLNGTLEECTGGPVSSGTAISICGVGLHLGGALLPSGGYNLSPAFHAIDFVHTSQEAAVNGTYTANPAYNGTCDAYYRKNGLPQVGAASAAASAGAKGARLPTIAECLLALGLLISGLMGT